MKEYSIEDISRVQRPTLGSDVPLFLFRILRIIGMRKILGETSSATLYMMGKQVGKMFEASDIEGFKEVVRELKLGIPEVEILDEDTVLVRLYECITCAGFPFTGEIFCDMESGIIAGILENVFRKRAKSTQRKSWSTGFNYCEFEVVLF